MAGGWGYEQPVETPRHGLYTEYSPVPATPPTSSPTIGILFYRSHWLSGNTDFVDALIEAVEAAGGSALPIFTTSLKELNEGSRLHLSFSIVMKGSASRYCHLNHLLCNGWDQQRGRYPSGLEC